MKRVLFAVFIVIAGVFNGYAVPEVGFKLIQDESLCKRYEYPSQTLEYNGRKVKLGASMVYKTGGKGEGYDFLNLTLRFSPVGAKGFRQHILDSISRLGRCNTVVERVEYNVKGATATFKGEACMYTEAFSMFAHNEEAKAVARYKVKFNAYDPAKSSITCELAGKEWSMAGDIVVGGGNAPDGGRAMPWRINLHETGYMGNSPLSPPHPGRIVIEMHLSQPARYANGVRGEEEARYVDRLCLSLNFHKSMYDKETGEFIGGVPLTFDDGYVGEPPYFKKYAVGKKGTREITVEETAPMEEKLPFVDWRFPASMDYRIYVKGAYLNNMDNEILYIKEAVFTCLFHNYGYPTADDWN